MPDFTNKYYNMSQGEGDGEGPWNTGPLWETISDRDQQAAVDGGDGSATAKLTQAAAKIVAAAAARTASDPSIDPTTGAELGAGPGAGILEAESPVAPSGRRK
jgi:Mn-containing catalase